MMVFLAWCVLVIGIIEEIGVIAKAIRRADGNDVGTETLAVLVALTIQSPLVIFPILWLVNR